MYTGQDFNTKFKPREFLETQELSFIKQDGLWFADLPDYLEAGGSFGECLMVSGADSLIDFLACGKDYITLIVSLSPIRDNNELDYDVLLIKKANDVEQHSDVGGASYQAIIPPWIDSAIQFTQCWLCSVSTFVFNGKHPDIIFIKLK